MRRNTRKNREKLIKKLYERMDLTTIDEMIEDQLYIFFENLSDKEFTKEWNEVFHKSTD
jgi:hypothetical protein